MYRINLLLVLPLIFQLTSCVTVKGSNETDFKKASNINVQLGIGYYHRGNIELANAKLVKALKQNPESSQAHHAYPVLQNHFLDAEKAELHFNKAIELDENNSEAFNNFGAFLCSDKRFKEADKMFMQAVKNPLYRSPEVAFTSAAVCTLKEGAFQRPKAKEYLTRALAIGNNFRPALINMAEITFAEKDNQLTSLYLKRYHLTGAESARSLWVSIQNEMDLNNNSKVNELVKKLEMNFANSKEHKQWLALNK
ncbi:MAG: type IV pilus biogenesis/stability protein PilW [Gammaproteobacteria bacterium]|nr:type IV pilus biogenesis/stability protein PilW [Gammaproteobacteria bacterium]